ncbi:MAG: hypothetical protein KKA19_09980, partial [Candidatus Margulisbacteria bacterium]|nr:hypothetical protein [Candidatus Margulisiibacteriota bacterium]
MQKKIIADFEQVDNKNLIPAKPYYSSYQVYESAEYFPGETEFMLDSKKIKIVRVDRQNFQLYINGKQKDNLRIITHRHSQITLGPVLSPNKKNIIFYEFYEGWGMILPRSYWQTGYRVHFYKIYKDKWKNIGPSKEFWKNDESLQKSMENKNLISVHFPINDDLAIFTRNAKKDGEI